MIQTVLQDRVHQSLKGSWRVAKPEGHYNELKQPPTTRKRGLEFVAFLDPNLMVTCA